MKTLVIGGTGLIGAHAARLLADGGDEVTIAARRAPEGPSLVGDLAFVAGDYAAGDLGPERLAGFDAVVMAASADVRNVRPDASAADVAALWRSTQSEGVPALARAAREAGVTRFVQVGSCYHVLRPDWVGTDPYVRARRDADEGARALTTPDFAAITVNPPPIVGIVPATVRMWSRVFAWASGQDTRRPLTAPTGGTNFVSVRSLAEAIRGALLRGTPGEAYLIGDENLSYVDYFQAMVDVSGGDGTVEAVDVEHWFLPDRMVVPGRATMFSYEPDPVSISLLGYRRGDVRAMLAEMAAQAGVRPR